MRLATSPFRLHPLDYATALSFTVYAASATVTPICLVILSRELVFSLLGGGGIEAVRTALLVGTLLVSGWAAAHWGKILCLGISAILLGAGLMLYAIAPAYAVVLLAMGVVGVGGGVIEALLNPLIQDLHPTDSGRYLNFLNAFFPLGVLLVVLGGGEWLTRDGSWRWVMAGLGFVCIVSGGLFLMLRRSMPLTKEYGAAMVLGHKVAVLRHPRFWLFAVIMFLCGGAEGGLTFWSASYIQLHFQETPRMGGIGTAMFALGMIAGRVASGWWTSQQGLWKWMLICALAGVPVSALLPALSGLTGLLIGLLLAGLCIACFWPSLQSYAVDRMNLDPTILFILLSCGGMAGFGFVPWFMGWLGETVGLNAALYSIPIFLALLAGLICMDRLWRTNTPR